jgi:RimJ/RimL family protein N-acetyltransferase
MKKHSTRLACPDKADSEQETIRSADFDLSDETLSVKRLRLVIFNARQTPPTEDEIRTIVEIEYRPEVQKWLTEYTDPDPQKELQSYQKFFRKLPKNRRVEVLIAKSDGRLVGFLALWRLGRYMEHIASLGLSVHPDYWGAGIASKLIESAIETAKEKGFKRIEIETLAENTAMRRVAEKKGFELECVRKKRIRKDGAYHDESAYALSL